MNGDTHWYDTWIAPVEDQMIRAVWRIVRNEDDAEDVLQNAVTTVWNRLDRVKAHPNPKALVMRIAIDAARDWLRKKIRISRFQIQGIAQFQWIDGRPLMQEILEKEETESEIIQAIVRLPKKQSAAVYMRIVEERPYEEIAQALNCTETTVRIQVSKGREKLSRWLSHLCPELVRSTVDNERESQTR